MTVTERPQDRFADVGSIITFECLTNGSEPIIYHWFKDSVRIEEDEDRILGLDERILNITTVESSDYGYYRCDVNNLVNADLSEHALLTGVCLQQVKIFHHECVCVCVRTRARVCVCVCVYFHYVF